MKQKDRYFINSKNCYARIHLMGVSNASMSMILDNVIKDNARVERNGNDNVIVVPFIHMMASLLYKGVAYPEFDGILSGDIRPISLWSLLLSIKYSRSTFDKHHNGNSLILNFYYNIPDDEFYFDKEAKRNMKFIHIMGSNPIREYCRNMCASLKESITNSGGFPIVEFGSNCLHMVIFIEDSNPKVTPLKIEKKISLWMCGNVIKGDAIRLPKRLLELNKDNPLIISNISIEKGVFAPPLKYRTLRCRILTKNKMIDKTNLLFNSCDIRVKLFPYET